MEFEFKNFGFYTSKIQSINDLRETLKLPPLWMDYESLHQLHTYKQNFYDFVNPKQHDELSILLKVPIEEDILNLEEIKSSIYTHIGLALQNSRFLVLLSNKPFAIDQIQKLDDCYEISIVRIHQYVHLWGFNVVYADGKKQEIGPQNIQLSHKEAEYIAKINKNCIAAQFILTEIPPIYKRRTYSGMRAPAKSKKFQFFKIIPIKSSLNKIVNKVNSKARTSAFKKLGVMNSQIQQGSIVPKISLNKQNCGSLFGNSNSTKSADNNLEVNLEHKLQLFGKSIGNKNNFFQKFELKKVPDLTEIVKNKQFPRKSKVQTHNTKEIQNLVVTEMSQKMLQDQKQVQNIVQKIKSISISSIHLNQIQMDQPVKSKWAKQQNHPFSKISIDIILKQSMQPPLLLNEDQNTYFCNYPPYQGQLSSIQILSQYLETKNKQLLQINPSQVQQIYQIANQLKLKDTIKNDIITFGIVQDLNFEKWQSLCKILSKYSVNQEVKNVFYSYYKSQMKRQIQKDQLLKMLTTKNKNSHKISRNFAQILFSRAQNFKQVEEIFQLLLRGQNIKIAEKLNQQSETLLSYNKNIDYFDKAQFDKAFQSNKNLIIQGSKTTLISTITNPQLENIQPQQLYSTESLNIQYKTNYLQTKRKTWIIVLQQFNFMNRKWRILLEKNEKGCNIFIKQCGSTDLTIFNSKFSSFLFYFELTSGDSQQSNTMFYSFANSQNQIIGIPLSNNIESGNFKLTIKLKPCYTHSFCLETYIHSSQYLFQNQQRKLSIEDVFSHAVNSKPINPLFFNQNQIVRDDKNQMHVAEWANGFNQIDLYWLLNHNLFRAYNQKQVLEMLMYYYENRSQNHSIKQNTWMPLLGVRYRYIPLEILLEFKKSILQTSVLFRSIVDRQVKLYVQNNNRINQNGRYLSNKSDDIDTLNIKLIDNLKEYKNQSRSKSKRLKSDENVVSILA